MSAGTGVRHSEFNASKSDPVHFLQIWILPEKDGMKPGYEQKTFSDTDKRNQLKLIGSHDGRDGSVTIHQDVDLYATLLADGASVSHEIASGRGAWVQVAKGSVRLNDTELGEGDGVAIGASGILTLTGVGETEVLLFDMGP